MNNEQKLQTLADALGATIESIQGGDNSTWFSVQRPEWVAQIRANPEKYAGVNAWEAFARHTFNNYFAAEVRRFNPSVRLGKLPAYAKVFDWVLNNYGKGLFLIGQSGTGKTAIINAIRRMFEDGAAMWFNNESQTLRVEKKCFAYYRATDLIRSEKLDEALRFRFIIIDDIGIEPETSINYGTRRNPVIELIDNAERINGLIILTSNLTPEQLYQKYGERTIDRLNALCKTIQFVGESFRGAEIETKTA